MIAYVYSERGRHQHMARAELEMGRLRRVGRVSRCGYRPKWGWVETDSALFHHLPLCSRCEKRPRLNEPGP